MIHDFIPRGFLLIILTSWSLHGIAQDTDTVSLDELNQQLENPLSRFWSLIVQENINFNTGTLVEGTRVTNNFFFQPSLPVPIGKAKMLLVRPVFPIITVPEITPSGITDNNVTGFGDMQVFSLYGPDKKGGIIWGLGLTFIFPTAASDNLGQGKFQMGPAFMVLNITKKWTSGTIVQHWQSVAGDENRSDANHTDIQYIIRRQIQEQGCLWEWGPRSLLTGMQVTETR